MKIKARPQLHIAPIPEGVYVSGGRGQFVLRGPDVLYRVADVTVPLMEDGATEDELVTALGTERARPVVRHVVDALARHGMLIDLGRLTVGEPPGEVRARHPESLAHLELLTDDPYAAFERVRSATVVLLGPDEVVRPARRGLERAGVGRVVIGRLGDAAAAPTAVLEVLTDGGPPRPAGRPDVAVPVLPVVLGERALVVGPVRRPGQEDRWSDLSERVLAWGAAEQRDPPARPVADALAGALAAHLLFEILAGLAVDGTAHVVHGPDLESERVVLGRPEPGPSGPCRLEAAPVGTAPGEEALDGLVAAVSRPWTGLLTTVSDDHLPQIPLALRMVRPGVAGRPAVVGWSTDQRAATVSAVLETMRRRGSCSVAAGLDEESWLLDGALRRIAAVADGDTHAVADTGDAGRVRRELRRGDPAGAIGADGADGADVTVRVRPVPGLDWVLGEVAAADGSVVAMAWAPDAQAAALEALSTALAASQTRRVTGTSGAVGTLRTDALLAADTAAVAALRAQVVGWAAARGQRWTGTPWRWDPVLGDLPVWSGPVDLCSTTAIDPIGGA